MKIPEQVISFVRPRLKGIAIGTYPSFIAWIHLWFLARNPTSFTRRIAQKMMWDRNPQNTLFADKLLVREYVRALIGPHYLSSLLWSGKNIANFDFKNAPDSFVIKPNHGSHAAVLVSPNFDEKNILPNVNKWTGWQQYFINPASLDLKNLRDLTDYWLSLSYYKLPNKFHEWAYKNIDRQIIIEEFLSGANQTSPEEFRFFMFDGKCELIYCISDRFGQEQIALLNSAGMSLDGEYLGLSSNKSFHIPKEFSEMMQISIKLSKNINFVRVDLYLTEKGIVFSELTNYPMGALTKFRPAKLNKAIGANWHLQ